MTNLSNQTCQKCNLHLGRRRVVNGVGNPNANLMLVGEAPGTEEDFNGIPFCGGAGRILTSLLVDAKWMTYIPTSKESYGAGYMIHKFTTNLFITNICRCKPPSNRVPMYEEVNACKEYLIAEINTVKPQMIVALGETASLCLTGHAPNPWRGCIVPSFPDYSSIPCLVTYHPAYLMRNRDMYSVVCNDLTKLHDPPKDYGMRYKSSMTYEDVETWCEAWKDVPVALDIETTTHTGGGGLNPFRDLIMGLAFCGEPGKAFTLTWNQFQQFRYILEPWMRNHKHLVYAGNLFDRAFLAEKGIPCQVWWDVQAGMHLINPDLPKDLNFLRSLYTNIPPYKKSYQSQGLDLLKPEDLATYNCLDVDTTLQCAMAQMKSISQTMMARQCALYNVALKMRQNGVYVNKQKLGAFYASIQPQVAQKALDFYAKYKVEISSSKQLSSFVYKDLNFDPPPKAVKAKSISVDVHALEYLIEHCIGDPPEKAILQEILDYRTLAKVASTYCEGVFKCIEDDDRVHPDWRSTGADTGRWACSTPNLQNVPLNMKDIFEAQFDNILLYADFDRLEVWVAALIAEDEVLLDLLKRNVDIHEELRSTIARYWPAITRTQAKTVLFGTFYGRSPADIARWFRVTKDIAAQWQEIFFNKYVGIQNYFRYKIPKDLKDKGYVETIYGRRKYCERETQAMNFPIQSTASEITADALIAMHDKGFKILINGHDAITVEDRNTDRFDEFLYLMQNSCQLINHVFAASGKTGKSWKEVVE